MVTDRFIQNRNEDGDLVFRVNMGGSPTEAMRIDGATGALSSPAGALADMASGTFTSSDTGKSNLTGTATFGSGKWRRVGNLVYVYLGSQAVSGLSVTSSSNVRTFLNIALSGLPAGTDISSGVGGTGMYNHNATDMRQSVAVRGTDTTAITLEWGATSPFGTGAITIYDVTFVYNLT